MNAKKQQQVIAKERGDGARVVEINEKINSKEFQVSLDFFGKKMAMAGWICPRKIKISYYHDACFDLPDALNFLNSLNEKHQLGEWIEKSRFKPTFINHQLE